MPRFRSPVISTAAQLADGVVTTPKLADDAVTTPKLAALAVEASKLADSSVTATKIANLAVGTAAIANLAVTNAKIADLSVSKLTAGTINAGNIFLASGLFLDGSGIIATNSSGARVALEQDTGTTGSLKLYNSGGSVVAVLGAASGNARLGNAGADFYYELREAGGDPLHRFIVPVGAGSAEAAAIGEDGLFLRGDILHTPGSGDMGIYSGLGTTKVAAFDHNPMLTLYTDADNEVLIKFATERSWILYQDGSGSGTHLTLQAEAGGKEFRVQEQNGDYIMRLRGQDVRFPGRATTTDSGLAAWRNDGFPGDELLALSSSIRNKRDVKDLDVAALARRFLAVRMASWRSGLPRDDGRRRFAGWIAEETHRHLPAYTAAPDPDGYVSGIGSMEVPMAATIHHLAERVAALEAARS